jgi:Domain of unknown function (DUF4314)
MDLADAEAQDNPDTWVPAPAGCSLTLDRRGPDGEHAAYRGAGPTMQDAWDEVRAQLGHGQPRPAGGITREARGRFERGDRVALEHTDDLDTRLRPGDEGTVTRYTPGLGQLDVRWDSGSTLSMLPDEWDRVRLITPAPEAGTGEAGKEPGR